ncbi:hypothetical protein G9A89_006407 [Geosiphon pyriformis]|nr:hypothetical protein G9A89_006407 [Geosiphon pyriformis]
MAARDSLLEMVANGIVLIVLGIWVLYTTGIQIPVDILLVAAADKLEVDTLVVDRLVAASLADNYFDIGLNLDLDNNLEFGTGNWGFEIDFPIIGYLNTGNSPFGYALVYHNSGRYVFSVAIVDWLMQIDVVEFKHN